MSTGKEPTVPSAELKERYQQLMTDIGKAELEINALCQADPSIMENPCSYEDEMEASLPVNPKHVRFDTTSETTHHTLFSGASHPRKRLTDAHETLQDTGTEAEEQELVSMRQIRQMMSEDRRATANQFQTLIDTLSTSLGGLNRNVPTPMTKLIPQAPPMSEREDLMEYFQLFENTQLSREVPEEMWPAVLRPLLNHTCRALTASLPATIQMNYRLLKKELLAEADSHSEATIQVFWEHKKKAGTTWREEVAQLTKLAARCAPGHTPEDVRKVFIMEQVTQQLPRNIQLYVRERQPKSPNEVLQHIAAYFRAHGIDEQAWETRDPIRKSKEGANQSPRQSQGVHKRGGSPHGQQQRGQHQQHQQQQPPHQQPQQHQHQQPQYENKQDPIQSKTYGRGPYRDMSTIKCHNCGQLGHFAWQCVKVNLVSLPVQPKTPPVVKQGRVGGKTIPWMMDSGADISFIAEDLLPQTYQHGPPVYAKGALHPDGKCCPTAIFPAEVDGKKTTMQAAIVPRSELPYPAIVGRDGTGLHIVWDAVVTKKPEETATSETTSQECPQKAEVEPIPEAAQSNTAPIPNEQQEGQPLSSDTITSLPIQTPLKQDIDLNSLDPVKLLAVRTRAQRKREQQSRQLDQEATEASGAEIHPLLKTSARATESGPVRDPTSTLESHPSPTSTQSVDSESELTRDPTSTPESHPLPTSPQSVDAGEDNGLEEGLGSLGAKENVIITDPFTRHELIIEQKKDKTLSTLFKAAKQGSKEFILRNDVLYAIDLQQLPDETAQKIVVPRPLRARILDLAHGKAGHFGHKKTRKNLLAHFYWPNVTADIQRHCQGCTQCLAFNSHRQDKQPQQLVPVITKPWRKLAMDVVGPLTQTKSGHRYLLTVIDLATRYPVAVPLKRVDAPTTANALVEIFSAFGTPEEIQHDNGGNFTSQLLQEVLRTLGIHAIATSPYHPESNGVVERMHGTLKKALKKAGAKASTWDKWLSQVLFVLRITPHEATGYSPFQLLFGRKPDTPISSFRSALEEPDEELPQSVRAYLEQLRTQMQIASEAAGLQELSQKVNSKTYQDERKKAQESLLEPGSFVLCLEPKHRKGLSAKWLGPYPVKKRLGLTTYLLDVGHGKTTRRHRNALKPYNPEAVKVCSLVTALPDEEAEDGITLEDHCSPSPDREKTDTHFTLPDLSHLQGIQRQQMEELLVEYQDVFNDVPDIADFPEYHLDTGDNDPVSQPPYRPGLAWREKVKDAVKKLLDAGFVRPSTSPWSSPVIPVPKPDGSIRLVVDYRKINSLTATDRYPLPRMDELLAQVGKARYLSTLDLSQGYHQVALDKETIPKTAFLTTFGKYEYLRLPFGLVNAPTYFQRLMDETLADHPATPYLDDIAVANQEWSEHLQHLRDVLQICRRKKISLKLAKCKFGNGTLEYLGHQVGSGQILPQKAKVKAIVEFPKPKTKKQLQSFLGLTGYYRDHIPGYSSRSAKLSDLTQKKCPDVIQWTPELEEAFLDVRTSILDSPVLTPPDPDKVYHLFTDASGVGLGAVLKQDHNGKLKPIAFQSYKLKQNEKHYSVIELETYAIIRALQHFAVYLRGAEVVIHTDHRALKFLQHMKNSSPRLMRWAVILQSYDYSVQHLPGHLNIEADALSRTWDDGHPTSGPFRGGGCWAPPAPTDYLKPDQPKDSSTKDPSTAEARAEPTC